MFTALANLFRVPEIRKKIGITLGLLFVSRIGTHIPLPGVDVEAWYAIVSKQADSGVTQIVGLMNALSGGNLNSPVLFSLGILPYITASIILSLLVKVIPSLEALSKEGPAGQKKINQYSRLLTVPLCIFQSIAICYTFFRPLGEEGNMVVPNFGLGFVIMAVLAITAGTIFLMWLGEQITEYGIGNGVSLLITAGIVADIPLAFYRMLQLSTEDPSFILKSATLLVMYTAIVVGVVYMTKGQRRIPIQQAKLVKGRRMVGGARHYLPVKLNMANVMPVIFASSLLILPSTIIGWVSGDTSGRGFLSPGGWWWITLEIGLIFFFSYFWTSLMFQPSEMANNLKEYGSFIPGIRPGKKTADFLERVMVRVTLVGAAFLAVIAIIPTLVAQLMQVDYLVAQFLGGTGILIVVGVSLDLVDKLNASLLQRNYEGFMSASASKRGGRTFG
jgi:preprotein translocase subunit SecY